MSIKWGILLGVFCFIVLPALSRAEEGPEAGRDQTVLDAILRVEQRYLEEDRRDPNVGYSRVLVAEVKGALYGGNPNAVRDAQGRSARKAKYLDKLLSQKVLTTATVLEAYKKAQRDSEAQSGSRALFRSFDRDRFEALNDLVKELRLKPAEGL